MLLEKVQLFDTKKDFLLFLFASIFILCYSLLIEYNNYKNLTLFDSAVVNATVLKQYTKTKLTSSNKTKAYQVLKLKSDEEFSFYTTAKKSQNNIIGKKLTLEVFAGKISFYEYLTTFYAYSKIIKVTDENTIKQKLNNYIQSVHQSQNSSDIYTALYTASPLPKDLQITFSSLGVSHLLAISGFHLGVLAAVLFFIFKLPYKYLQNRYFPYRSYKLDSFVFIAITLLAYLLFLDSPPSLLRAYAMMIIGFILYDRGYEIISMQTLLLTIILLLSLFPRLFFSLGFGLSIAGVFYIFVFLIHFKELSKIWQLILLPFWVYFMMLPYSLVIFESFSIYHPLSIIWTSLFTLFYPLSIFLHLIGFGDLLDTQLEDFILLTKDVQTVYLDKIYLIIFIIFSFLSIYKRGFIWILLGMSLSMMIDSFVQIT